MEIMTAKFERFFMSHKQSLEEFINHEELVHLEALKWSIIVV